MRKNRIFLAKGYIFLIMTGIFLCWYVFLFANLIAVGYVLEELQAEYEELFMVNRHYRAEVLTLTSPEHLLRQAEVFDLELKPLEEWRYVYVPIY